MCKKAFVLMTLLFVPGLVGSVLATTFYCDPVSGSMSNDGSSGSPWSTLQAVFDNNKIESRDKNLNTINSGAPVKAGDTIKLRSGNHGSINETGGYHNTAMITIEAQSGHTPKLTSWTFNYASNWTIRGLEFAYGMGSDAIYIVNILSGSSGTATHDITIDDCYIYSQEDSSGWTITEWNNVPNAVQLNGSGNVIVQDCTMKNIEKGVQVNSNCKVIGCSIQNFAKDGIRCGGSNITLEENDILDAYAVNTNHDDAVQVYCGYTSASNIIMRKNFVMNDTSGGTRNYISLLEGLCSFDDAITNFVIENNVVICGHYHGITMYNATNCTVANNTAYNPGYVAGENDRKTWITVSGGTGNTLINNLMHSSTSGSNMQVTPTNYTQFFVNTNPSNLDLHLKAGSPAIDAGTSSGAPSEDFDGVSRPQGSGYDVGAYEYVTGNQAPVADAGDDQYVTDSDENGSELVSLDGSESYDTDGSITSYVWKEDSNQIATGVDPDVTLSVGEHTIELTVTDNNSATDVDTVVVTVYQPGNLPPVADAGNDQQVTDNDDNGSETVQLDASNSYDPDGSIVSYVWKEGGNQIATGVDPNVSFNVGQHTVTLIVTDNNDANDTDTVSVTVNAPWPVTSTSSWQNFGFNSQTGSFTFECDVTPNASNMDGVLALLVGEADAYSDSACRFRFYTNGYLEVLDGSSFYQRDVDIAYSTGTSYHLEMDIDIPSRTYDVYVTPEGSSRQTLASDYEFAPEQPSVTSLDHWAIKHESGSFDVCDVQVIGGTGDLDAPDPDPMTWSTEPYAASATSISMTATTATDTSGVEYYFDCTTTGGHDSGWQDSTTYTDTGLSVSTQYSYQVKARDKSTNQNETAFSTLVSATTSADTTAPSPDPMTFATDPHSTSTSTISMTATTASDISDVEYFFDCTSDGGHDSSWQDSTTYVDSGLDPNTEYGYLVMARDKSANQNETEYSTVRYATTNAEGPDPNLEAWWKFDETSGTSASDSSGNSHTGTLENGASFTSGYINNAANFDGSDDRVSCGTWNVTGSAITICAWFKADTFTGSYYDGRLVSKTTSTAEQDHTWMLSGIKEGTSNKRLRFRLKTGGTTNTLIATSGNMSTGTWYHGAAVYNGSTMKLYLDADEVGSTSKSGSITTSSSAIAVGHNPPDAGTVPWDGLIDDVRIYDRALSESEIEELMNPSAPDTNAPSPDPMTWATEPYAVSSSSIAMTATTATDANGVEYYFECTAGGGNDSGWQDSTEYTDTGLSELTEYTYRVKARDKSSNQNETAYSAIKSATTQDGTAPTPNPMTFATEPYAVSTSSISMAATTATDASGVEYYFECTAGGGNDSGWQDSSTYTDTGLSELTEYTYRVKASDKSSNQNETAYSTTKSATTLDGTAPAPNPMTWSTEPYATGSTSISMTATTATDVSGVEYYFLCTAGGGHDSGWQDSTTYADTGLSEATEYTYRVKARDKSSNQNETGYSTTKSATTQDGTAPSPDPMTWATEPYATGSTSISMTATTATDASGVEYYFECTAGGGNDSNWQDSTTYEDTGLDPNTSYTYRVKARDKSSNQNETAWSTTKSATTDTTGGQNLEFTASEDTYVSEQSPNYLYGSWTTMRVRTNSDKDYFAYIKVTVSGASGTVTSAKLKIRVYDASIPYNVSAWAVTGSWSEGTLTWNNDNLSWGGSALDTKSGLSAETWYEWDVTSAVSGNGTYTFGMKSSGDSSKSLYSTESAYDPQLLVETNGGE